MLVRCVLNRHIEFYFPAMNSVRFVADSKGKGCFGIRNASMILCQALRNNNIPLMFYVEAVPAASRAMQKLYEAVSRLPAALKAWNVSVSLLSN